MTAQGRIDKGLYWDRAWSLVEGCSPVSTGCLHCWSAQQAHMRQFQRNPKIKQRYMGLTNLAGKWTGRIRLMHRDITKPLHVRKPTTWSVWNDLFHKDVPFEFIGRVFATMIAADWHTFQILTKRPERMLSFISWFQAKTALYLRMFRHIWLGVSCENQATADERIPLLLQTPAMVRFVSCEPLLDKLNLRQYLAEQRSYSIFEGLPALSWCIAGAESGPGARPMDEDWVRGLKNQCQAAGVPFFYKQAIVDGKKVSCPELDGKQYKEMPEVSNATCPD